MPSNHKNPVIWSLTASVAIVGSNSLALGPIAPDIANDLQSSLSSILQASAAFGAGTAISAFLLARLIDRFGIRFSLCAALSILTVAFTASAASTSAWHLVIAQLIAGVAAGIALPACYSGAAVIAPPGQSSRVLGIVLTGWTISLVLGVSLSTIVADNIHWRSVYGFFAIVSAAITLFNLRANLPGKPPPQPPISMLRALKIKGVPMLLLQVACYMTAFYGVYNLVGDHVVSSLQQPLSANAWVALSYGTGFGLAVLLDPFIDKISQQNTLAAQPQNATEKTSTNVVVASQHQPIAHSAEHAAATSVDSYREGEGEDEGEAKNTSGKRLCYSTASNRGRQISITAVALFTLAILYVALAYSSGNFQALVLTAGIWGFLNHLGLNILIASLNQTNTNYRGAVLGLYSGITYVCMSIGTLVFSSIYQRGSFTLLCLFAAVLCLLATFIAIYSERGKSDLIARA